MVSFFGPSIIHSNKVDCSKTIQGCQSYYGFTQGLKYVDYMYIANANKTGQTLLMAGKNS